MGMSFIRMCLFSRILKKFCSKNEAMFNFNQEGHEVSKSHRHEKKSSAIILMTGKIFYKGDGSCGKRKQKT